MSDDSPNVSSLFFPLCLHIHICYNYFQGIHLKGGDKAFVINNFYKGEFETAVFEADFFWWLGKCHEKLLAKCQLFLKSVIVNSIMEVEHCNTTEHLRIDYMSLDQSNLPKIENHQWHTP